MTTLGDQLATIDASPEGPRIGAFFDLDVASPEAHELLRAHQDRGHTIVLASHSGGPHTQDLGIEHVLDTDAAKAEAARKFAREHSLDARASFAYADGDEDGSLLAGFGRPCAVKVAETGGGGLRGAVATATAVAGMNAALAAGLVVGRLLGNRRTGANLALGPAMDLVLALTGVRLRVSGRPHLAERPAVFVFNHQSNLDPLVAGALIRRDFTATGKQEAKWDPAGALAGMLMNAVFLDRSDPESAKQEINTLVDRLHDGESVMIAPEGTRRPTPALGPFKHGAFHVAREAGVPIVGIVLRNTGRLMARNSPTIRSGTVDVRVLEPVSTATWKRRDVGRHANAVRAAFDATLRRWPAHDRD